MLIYPIKEVSELSRLKTDLPFYLFHNGINCTAYEVLGSSFAKKGRGIGYRFRVWAPDAKAVSVIGTFNGFDSAANPLQPSSDSEIWEGFIPKVEPGACYRYAITTQQDEVIYRIDPYAQASGFMDDGLYSMTISPDSYEWHDDKYLENRGKRKLNHSPLNIYSVHLGSWKRDGDGNFLSYRKLGEELSLYASRMGFTHIHLLPITEHCSDPTWGYSPSLLFAPNSRFGSNDDLKYLVDCCHRQGIGVILEIPTASFPKEPEALGLFDGTPLYEEFTFDGARPNKKYAFSKGEIQSFLLSSCNYWLDIYHIDGLKLDGVGTLLYPEFGRRGERWRPSVFADRSGETAELLRKINTAISERYPDVLIIADDANPFPNITTPVERGGLGFHYCCNNNWTADTLGYMALESIYRSYNHDKLTYTLDYPSEDKALLSCDHTQFVHGKRSLIARMTGDYWEQFAMVRAFWGYMICHPGGKLHFMGNEIGQFAEWNFQKVLDWNRLNHTIHQDLQRYVKELNQVYQKHSPLWELDDSPEGFSWVIADDSNDNLLAFCRHDQAGNHLLVVCNFSEKSRRDARIGVPFVGQYREVINSDAIHYGGKGNINPLPITALPNPEGNFQQSIRLNIPPLGTTILRHIP